MKLTHIPLAVRATVLAHARDMRSIRGDQQPDQWLDARYRAAADLAHDLRRLHGIHAPQWARDLIFQVAT
jgi:hypothetical protein